MKKVVILLLFLLPIVAVAQKAQKIAELNKFGKEAILKNDSAKAIQYFEQAIKLDSLNKTARLGYALTHKDTRTYEILSELLTYAPEDTSLHILRAYCALTIEKQYRKVLDRNLTSLWFGRTVNDYQWLIMHKTNISITHYNLDNAQATWAGNTMWGINASTPISQATLKAKEAEAEDITKNDYLALFIGRPVKGNGLDIYLQNCLNYSPIGNKIYMRSKKGDLMLTYSVLKNTGTKKKGKLLTLIFTLNNRDEGIIKRVSISGNRFDVGELFASYWPAFLSVQQVREKRVAHARLLTDKITFTSWNPDYAVIIISPAPTTGINNR